MISVSQKKEAGRMNFRVKKGGYLLIELMVALILLMILATGFGFSSMHMSGQIREVYTQLEALSLVSTIVEEIRLKGNIPSNKTFIRDGFRIIIEPNAINWPYQKDHRTHFVSKLAAFSIHAEAIKKTDYMRPVSLNVLIPLAQKEVL